MSVWDKITELAKNYFGDEAPEPRHFPRIRETVEPNEQPRQPPPTEAIEVLREYYFIAEALQNNCPFIFVTGEAGTGKSTLIRWLCKTLSGCVVVAPTAIAAMHVRGSTIHSFFGLPPRHIDPADYDPEDENLNHHNRLVIENMKYLIVDEVSMVKPNIVDVMSNILKKIRRNPNLFGGIPTIFVGDLLQLPPVITENEEIVYFSERYEHPYFFSADVFREQKLLTVPLKTVRRQADPVFINALNCIRTGSKDCNRHVNIINNTRCRDEQHTGAIEGIYLVPTNRRARNINARELEALPFQSRTYEAEVFGIFPVNEWKINVPDILKLKEEAKVIFLKNNKPQWINGNQGTVKELHDDRIVVQKEDRAIVEVFRDSWIKYKYTYKPKTKTIETEEIGSFHQYPLALGWAITIHKSQGLTLENLTLDLEDGAFCTGQVYVALSRAKTMEGITLTIPIRPDDIKIDQAILEFYRQL